MDNRASLTGTGTDTRIFHLLEGMDSVPFSSITTLPDLVTSKYHKIVLAVDAVSRARWSSQVTKKTQTSGILPQCGIGRVILF